MVEMHGRFTAAEASRTARLLEALDPEWREEPVPPDHMTDLARVRAGTTLPIATGERVHTVPEFRELFERGLCDVVQADLTHIGGITGLHQVATWAQAYNLLMAPHNVCGPVGTAANLHFAVACANYKVLEHFNDFADPWVATLVDRAPTVEPSDGCFPLPAGPGLGVRLDHDACAEHPRTGGRLQLFMPGWERRGPTSVEVGAEAGGLG